MSFCVGFLIAFNTPSELVHLTLLFATQQIGLIVSGLRAQVDPSSHIEGVAIVIWALTFPNILILGLTYSDWIWGLPLIFIQSRIAIAASSLRRDLNASHARSVAIQLMRGVAMQALAVVGCLLTAALISQLQGAYSDKEIINFLLFASISSVWSPEGSKLARIGAWSSGAISGFWIAMYSRALLISSPNSITAGHLLEWLDAAQAVGMSASFAISRILLSRRLRNQFFSESKQPPS